MKKRLTIAFLLVIILAMFLFGCSKKNDSTLDSAKWQEWGIGTPLAWSADYLLTTAGEVENLYRYDEITDCLLAMKNGYIDAIAIDSLFASYAISQNPDVKILDDISIGPDRTLAFIAKDRSDIQKEINEFIKKFRQSPQYTDLKYRANNFKDNKFVSDYTIKENKNGKILKVATDVSSGHYPYSFFDFASGKAQGVDVEFIRSFAYEYGYTIEWFDADWDACAIAVYTQKADVFVSACSEYYASEVEIGDNCIVSDPYFDLNLCLVVMKERDGNPNYIK